jgi:hypothetical protein
VAGLLMAMGLSANAQSLLHRYDFATDATDKVGTANGTLHGTASISGGSLVTSGNNGGISGQWGGSGPMLTLDPSAVSGITGAFTIEQWFTCTTGWPKFDTLFAFSDGSDPNSSSASYLLSAPVRGYSPWPSGIAVVGAGGLSRPTVGWDLVMEGIYLDSPGTHQTVLTYDGASFRYYVDGALSTFGTGGGPLSDPGFNLSTLVNIGINGGSPYSDPSLTGSTYDFRIYGKSLTAGEVSSVFALGADASNVAINNAVPEPSSLAVGIAGLAALVLRRREKQG